MALFGKSAESIPFKGLEDTGRAVEGNEYRGHEHIFVDKAITSAQGKLEAKVKNEVPASSEEDWFQKNMSR